jgi:hypothetical protein
LAGIWFHDHSQHISQRNLPSAVAGFRVLEALFGTGFTLAAGSAARAALNPLTHHQSRIPVFFRASALGRVIFDSVISPLADLWENWRGYSHSGEFLGIHEFEKS